MDENEDDLSHFLILRREIRHSRPQINTLFLEKTRFSNPHSRDTVEVTLVVSNVYCFYSDYFLRSMHHQQNRAKTKDINLKLLTPGLTTIDYIFVKFRIIHTYISILFI